MNDNVYISIYPKTTKFAWGEVIDDSIYDEKNIPLCPLCGQYVSGMKLIGEKTLEIRGRKNFPDFLYVYGLSTSFVISERALVVLKNNGVKGIIGTEKIDKIIVKKESKDITYYIMDLERCDIPIDYERSQIDFGRQYHPERICELCDPIGRTRDYIFSLYFNQDAKINMDIFHIYQMGEAIFLSEKFIKICNKNKLTGLFYANINEYDDWTSLLTEKEIADKLAKIEKEKK